MKAASSGMQAHIAGETPTLATLWRVTRTDGAVFCFTDHDRDVVYGGDTYLAALGYQRAAIASGADLAVDETELLGLLNSESIEEAELRAGVWDHAEVRIFLVNWANLGQGEIKLRRGRLGEVIVRDDGSFRAELRGLAQPLQSTVGSLYQAECRADYGDARCGSNVALFTVTSEIETVTASDVLVMAADGIEVQPDGWFEAGIVTWQDGDNAGISREVVAWNQAGRVLTLLAPPPYAPQAGETLAVRAGCDKRWSTCRDKFSNRLNFRGEPLVPGANAILETP